jgi:hypothetical protein
MPKATVKKDGESLRTKHKVGLSRQIEVSSPTGDSCSSENGKENLFCGFVTLRPDARHISRALFPS